MKPPAVAIAHCRLFTACLPATATPPSRSTAMTRCCYYYVYLLLPLLAVAASLAPVQRQRHNDMNMNTPARRGRWRRYTCRPGALRCCRPSPAVLAVTMSSCNVAKQRSLNSMVAEVTEKKKKRKRKKRKREEIAQTTVFHYMLHSVPLPSRLICHRYFIFDYAA